MAKNKLLLKIHTKRYVEAVFERRLREEGFVCPDDQYLCWYRFFGEEIVHSITFFTLWSYMPIHLLVGYGAHPLFVEPVFTTRVNFADRPFGGEVLREDVIREKGPLSYLQYSEDIQVDAPRNGGKGIYTFDEIILPQIEGMETVESCYQRHKQFRLDRDGGNEKESFTHFSGITIDEAIYVDDPQVYAYGISRVEEQVGSFKRSLQKYPQDKAIQQGLQKWELRRSVLLDGGREGYLKVLEERRKRNVAYLKKKFGLLL